MQITYGVSVGDYGKGLLMRAYRNGIVAESDTPDVFEAVMLERSDDRRYDATEEQWTAAYSEFQRGYAYMQAELAADDVSEEEVATEGEEY